jgi:hypothetical protein
MNLSDNPPASDESDDHDSRTLVKDLYRYIWSTSSRSQIILSGLSIAVFLLELVPLELQRRIVNGAVDQRGLKFVLLLCAAYVAVAVVHGALKLAMSVYRGSVTEAANQRLRMQIDPTGGAGGEEACTEKGVKVSIVVSEVEAVGGFVGSSFCDPLLNAGILVSVFGYMLVVQPSMAMVALAIFLPQLLFIPFLQNSINLRTKRRIKKLRAMSVDIVNEQTPRGEGDGQEDVPPADSRRLQAQHGDLRPQVRDELPDEPALHAWGHRHSGRRRLAAAGRQDRGGTIVAFISGLSKMNGPWGELVNYFRDLTNAGLKFRLIESALDRPLELSPERPERGPYVCSGLGGACSDRVPIRSYSAMTCAPSRSSVAPISRLSNTTIDVVSEP